MHPAWRRTLAEELVRLRSSDEPRRACAPQRAARIDPNPHQVQAVVFALSRLREGGCILADEVGLGKTIEAGLVISQLKAEGARRVLLIAPKSLLGQWKQELFQLFELETREGSAAPGAFEGEGVFLINREAAGSEKGHAALTKAEPFDLCVIDEAHEVFAGIWRRFTQGGLANAGSPHALTAARVKAALGQTPMLLLTATPIQNNLAELWGLVQYVDPLGTLLGDLPTFRDVFCGPDDRQLAPGVDEELRGRLERVVQRTLRRQAQPFLERPFVNRQARLFEYPMSDDERALYEDVTAYLLEPGVIAFQGRQRQLLLIGFHRRMASSTRALQASLERIAARLKGLTVEVDEEEEEEEEEEGAVLPPGPDVPPGLAGAELARVESFIARARALKDHDGKFEALSRALRFVSERAAAGQGSDKVVIFTESLVTQAFLREALIASGLAGDDALTLLSGTNDGARAHQAFARWKAEVPHDGEVRQSETTIRLALVHEFKTRSRFFICTEAGAKGLNLQFCNTVVNYDLPWNPQRIEQRIGRCHRYGQTHDVTVINFLARGNETQALTFDILSRKLELFGTVLDASDQVLHQASTTRGAELVSALGTEFEGELRRIYERARTIDEVQDELRALRDRVAGERQRFEETHQRTARVLAEALDEDVRRVFKARQEELPGALEAFDAAMLEVVQSAHPTPLVAQRTPQGQLVEVDGQRHGPLHLQHPVVVSAVQHARAAPLCAAVVTSTPERRGRRGTFTLVKVAHDGFEKVERLVPVLRLDDGVELPEAEALALLRDAQPVPSVPGQVEDAEALESQRVFEARQALDAFQQQRFQRALDQAERYVEDRRLVLLKRRAQLEEKLDEATRRRDGSTGSRARQEAEAVRASLASSLEEVSDALDRLERRDDERYVRHHAHILERRYGPVRLDALFSIDVRFT